jgi:integrase/recombinase XerD
MPGRKPIDENVIFRTDQLILSIGGSCDLKSSLLHLFRNLKQFDPQVKNATQIRQSVIASWLNKYDKRKVQYMAGHRYVSSTEYYKQVDIDLLKRSVLEYHPLK